MARWADNYLEQLQAEKDYYDYHGIEPPEGKKEEFEYWEIIQEEQEDDNKRRIINIKRKHT